MVLLVNNTRREKKRERGRGRFFLETGTARWQSALSTWHPTSLDIPFKVRIVIIIKLSDVNLKSHIHNTNQYTN